MSTAMHQTSPTLRLIIIAGFIIVAYMLYALTVSIYRDYEIDRHIKDFETEQEKLIAENQQKLADYQYYTSKAYIEKIAKQNLGLINPGEKVIILPDDGDTSVTAEEENEAELTLRLSKMNNPEKWWTFFFDTNPFKE